MFRILIFGIKTFWNKNCVELWPMGISTSTCFLLRLGFLHTSRLLRRTEPHGGLFAMAVHRQCRPAFCGASFQECWYHGDSSIFWRVVLTVGFYSERFWFGRVITSNSKVLSRRVIIPKILSRRIIIQKIFILKITWPFGIKNFSEKLSFRIKILGTMTLRNKNLSE